MNKFQKNIIIAIAVCFCLCCVHFFFKAYSEYQENSVKAAFDKHVALFDKMIEEEKLKALSTSILIAQNDDLIKCFLLKNHEYCKEVIQKYTEILSIIPFHENLKIHLHDEHYISLARSWSDRYNDNLGRFRYTLLRVANSQKPRAVIEMGWCGAFVRGISPVFSASKYLGAAEVMMDFEQITQQSIRQGYNVFILIRDKYSTECFSDQHSIINNYIVANKSADLDILPLLNDIELQNNKFTKIGENYFYIREFFDANNASLGFIVFNINVSEFKDH